MGTATNELDQMKNTEKTAWEGFNGRLWKSEINVRDFIQTNYTPYEGAADFLAEPTEATNQLWGKLQELQKQERENGGVLDMEADVVSAANAYGAGYIDESLKDEEAIVGIQTDQTSETCIHALWWYSHG